MTGDTLSSVCELLDFKQATPTPGAFSLTYCTRNKRSLTTLYHAIVFFVKRKLNRWVLHVMATTCKIEIGPIRPNLPYLGNSGQLPTFK